MFLIQHKTKYETVLTADSKVVYRNGVKVTGDKTTMTLCM